jgi:hypothetical protein
MRRGAPEGGVVSGVGKNRPSLPLRSLPSLKTGKEMVTLDPVVVAGTFLIRGGKNIGEDARVVCAGRSPERALQPILRSSLKRKNHLVPFPHNA